jgi:hypothetical protein
MEKEGFLVQPPSIHPSMHPPIHPSWYKMGKKGDPKSIRDLVSSSSRLGL